MQNVVLVIHLLLALGLTGIVLMQRSEGGGLGIGGGGAMTSRGVTSALGKLTWGLAVAFLITSIALTVIAAQNSSETSILDRIGAPSAPAPESSTPALPEGNLLPPAPTTAPSDPLAPPRAD